MGNETRAAAAARSAATARGVFATLCKHRTASSKRERFTLCTHDNNKKNCSSERGGVNENKCSLGWYERQCSGGAG